MTLNELNIDGVLTWLQLAYGPCDDYPCRKGLYETHMYICQRHQTYDFIKTLLDNHLPIDCQREYEWAKYFGRHQIVKLLQQYI